MSTNNSTDVMPFHAIDELKKKQKAVWEDGDYASFAKYMENGAIEVLDNWNISSGAKLLDVGCGSGQIAISAAKKGIQVTGIDIASNLIQYARERAAKSRLNAQFEVGDAECLPYENASFDIATSMFGAMFAPRPEVVSSEFARIIKPGGRLFMANWTAASMPAQMFKAVAKIVPPPAGIQSPVLWGDEETVVSRLENDFKDIKLEKKMYSQWQYPFPASDLVDLFRSCFGPVKRAFDVSEPSQQTTLHEELESIYTEHSEQQNGILTVTGGEYLDVSATRK